MKRSSFAGVLAMTAVLALAGAGCATVPGGPQAGPAPAVSPKLGFGKIPAMAIQPAAPPTADNVAVASSQAQAPSNVAAEKGEYGTSAISAAPLKAGVPTVVSGGAGVAAPSAIARPVPMPYPQPRLGTVEYLLEAAMPTWGSDGDVLQVQRQLPSASTVSGFTQQAGVPTQAFGSSATVLSMNASWRDADKLQWTFDAGSRTISFWKDVSTQDVRPDNQPSQPPKLDDATIVHIADAFLDAHGFSAIRSQGGTVQSYPNIYPMMPAVPMMKGGVSVSAGSASAGMYPCPLNATEGSAGGEAPTPGVKMMAPSRAPSAAGATGSGSVSVSSGAAQPNVAMPTIYPPPYPCGWWPQQATVTYGGSREGRKVVDVGGNPYQIASVTVDLSSQTVTNGNIQLEDNVSRSSYPLIDQATAQRRLQAGGSNPVWPYGYGTSSIKVHVKTIDVVWLRYDTWTEGTSQTYYLPGLLATGTVDRGDGNTQEEYRTAMPLLQDDAFDFSKTSSGGGIMPPFATGGAVQILPAPVPEPEKLLNGISP